jgi:hypothetical protein
MHAPTYAVNEIHSEASIKLVRVSAPGCHHQGIIQNKGVQGQHTSLSFVSRVWKLLKY